MPPKTRKRKAEVYIKEEEEAPWRGQTPTDRQKSTKYPTSTTSIQRRETLTQIGWIQSPQPADEIDDLEYEEDTTALPVEPIRPKPRRLRKERRKRFPFQKETLTQGGFISPYQERDMADFDFEEETLKPRSTSSSKKRAKIAKGEPLAREVQTRSVRRRAAQERATAVNTADTETASPTPYPVQSKGNDHTKLPMLPPKTPQTSRTREIPSSQSPPETPLSTQSRRSWATQTRSPLQERSPNILTAPPSAKRTLFPSKLEIADTFDSADEESEMPTAAKVAGKDFIGTDEPHDPQYRVDDLETSNPALFQGSAQLQSPISAPRTYGFLAESNQDPVIAGRQADIAHANYKGEGPTASRQGKSEILDSEDEETQSQIDDDDFPAGAATQAACNSIASSSSPTRSRDEPQPVFKTENSTATEDNSGQEAEDIKFNGNQDTEDGSKNTLPDLNILLPSPRTPRVHSKAPNFSIEAKAHSAEYMQSYEPAASPDEDAHGRNSRAVSELSLPDFNSPAISHDSPPLSRSIHSNVPTTPKPPVFYHLNTDVLQASRPNHKRNLSPQRFAPETESQFDNAWRPLSPPPQLSPFSSSPNHISPDDPSTPSLTSPFKHSLLPTQTVPIPPSQATTVDITQRTQPQLPLPFSSSTIKRPFRRLRSSSPSLPPPPPAPLLSSSPLLTRKSPHKNSWMGNGGLWDGRRLTDSQLLPDSLMNDSFAGPPEWEVMVSDGMEYEEE